MKIKLKCNNCHIDFERNKRDVRPQHKTHYCSRKCGLANASRIKYKDHKKTIIHCSTCGDVIDNRSKKKMCLSCYNIATKTKIENLTLGEIKHKHNSRKFVHWYSSEIRNFNRDWNKDLLVLPCQVCGYSRKVHLAHIKPICKFADTATLKEINSEDNNLVLCPNHHSEFDDGFISLADIPKRNGAPRGT